MLSRNKNLKSLERFVYKHLGQTEGSAYLISDIAGVILNIKSATQCDWPLSHADAKTLWLLKQKIEALRLVVLFDENSDGFKIFYIAKSHKRALALKEAFAKLHNNGPSPEVHTIIGRLLGYPYSAIQYYIRLHPENGMSENHRAMIERNRFYAHSLAHENDEFNIYEKPIYRYLSLRCPKTAAILKKNKQKRWLD